MENTKIGSALPISESLSLLSVSAPIIGTIAVSAPTSLEDF